MKDVLQQRLESLKSEYEAGQKMLAELDGKRANLTQTLLRIEGAMEVLRELLKKDAEKPGAAPSPESPPYPPRPT